jgi:hypothetical protein
MTDRDLEPLSPIGQALLELERTRSAPPLQAEVWAQLGTTLGFMGEPPEGGEPTTPSESAHPSAMGRPPGVPGGSLAMAAQGGSSATGAAAFFSSKLLFGLSMLSVGGVLGGTVVAVTQNFSANNQLTVSVQEPVKGPLLSQDLGAAPKPIEPESRAATVEAGTTEGKAIDTSPRVRKSLGEALPAQRNAQRQREVAAPEQVEEQVESRLKAERALLEIARTALAHGKAVDAITVLGQHEREFPNGQLSEERESLRVQCLVNSGKGSEARLRANEFRRRFPRSILLPAVDAVIESIPVTDLDAHPK